LTELRAGSATIPIKPPLGLPLVGFVRRYQTANKYGADLETSALVLDDGGSRVAIVGVDTLGIQSPDVDVLRRRIAKSIDAHIDGVLLNWNHTHSAPPGTRPLALLGIGGDVGDTVPGPLDEYIRHMHECVVEVARVAASRLERAAVTWGVGAANLAVNRREITPSGRVIIGWRPDGLVDNSVTVLQARRADASVIATAVNYGCHPVALGADALEYSSDFPGHMREYIRDWAGGDVIFLQGAAGNVIPRVGFGTDKEAASCGRRLALEALHAVADRTAGQPRWTRGKDGSATPYSVYRVEYDLAAQTQLRASAAEVRFPLLPLPSLEAAAENLSEMESAYQSAVEALADRGELNIRRFHLIWARRTEAAIRDGTAPNDVGGRIHAIRIGGGAIVTGPGEIFTEIGLAIKERSPALPTMYLGYTNGAVSYFPTAAAYPEGGYEPEFGNRTYGLPAPVAPVCEELLVSRSLQLLRGLFPDRPAATAPGFQATGSIPSIPPERSPEPPSLNSNLEERSR